MSNFYDMKCPKCGRADQIYIEATIWVKVGKKGTAADADGHEPSWDFESTNPAMCEACDHHGEVRDFDSLVDWEKSECLKDTEKAVRSIAPQDNKAD